MSENVANEQPTTQSVPELTVTDLQNIRAIIDVATRRGAFGAQELTAVGAVFDKLDAFLTAAVPKDTTATAEK